MTFFLLSLIRYLLCFSSSAIAIHRNNETDRLALLEFKAKISYDPFNSMISWNSSLHFCQWSGVICGRRNQRVTELNRKSLKLSGSISPHVGNLSFLRILRLENNSFSHEIPPQIGHLQRLQMLSVSNNSLSGQIPSIMSNCSSLKLLYLDYNTFSGQVPTGIGFLQKLVEIDVRKNNLTGTLPLSLGNLSSLQLFDASRNNFLGVIPDTFGKLMNLMYLTVYDNQFSGIVPPRFFNLSLLQAIDMGTNHFQGNLPMDIGISLPNLEFFSIVNNQFTGSIPPSISNASNIDILQLGGNNFTGKIPSLEKLQKILVLHFPHNHLGSGQVDDLNFVSTLSNATNLEGFGINHNNFGGILPQHFWNISKNMQEIVISHNQILGKIPDAINDFVELELFEASGNRLSGTVPSNVGNLQNLRYWFLDSNSFWGPVPSSIGNLTNLIAIEFSSNKFQGIIPSTIGNLTNLLELRLSNNNLSGHIPPQIFGLSPFSIGIDFSQNHLSGSLPKEVQNMKNMGTLNVSNNMLSGIIPAGLGSCKSLQFLYLGSNLFQGFIPSSLSSLSGLQELNLSHNMLSGKIPEFLATSFISLTLLDLSYNEFEGIVPIEGVFKNATATHVAGNKLLCGGIPDFKLPLCKLEHSKRGLTSKLKIIISVLAMLIGAAIILISLFLIFHSRKRKAKTTSIFFRNSLLKLSYQSLLKATNGFSSDNLIGTGSFGSVYKGILAREGIVIAVKVLNLERRGALKSFVAECEALRNIRHRNLVKVLTACSGVDYKGNAFKALVYEFMVNGSLNNWLHPTSLELNEGSRTLNLLQRLNIAIDVAYALMYLHHHSGTPIIHCDLKPSNILLDEEMTGHVSDFGLIKFLSNGMLNDSTSIGIRGTIGYCPPEYGAGGQVSTSGDIFSFGVLLLEIFTGKKPTDEMFKEDFSLSSFVKRALPEQVMQILDSNLLQMQNNNLTNMEDNNLNECLISVFEVGISCSIESPQERMKIDDAVVQLAHIKNKPLQIQLPRERQVLSAVGEAGD